VASCPNPFNAMTNNACYSTGALINGFSLIAINTDPTAEDLAVLTPTIYGVTNVAVGHNAFISDSEYTFNPPVSAAGMVIFSPVTSGNIDVDVYGPGEVYLGTATVSLTAGTIGTFLGAVTPGLISRIVLDDNGQTIAELVYDLYFGQCQEFANPREVPTLSEWGLIAMAGILGIAGFMVIRRRKATA